jgi:hypothetical protein
LPCLKVLELLVSSLFCIFVSRVIFGHILLAFLSKL